MLNNVNWRKYFDEKQKKEKELHIRLDLRHSFLIYAIKGKNAIKEK